MTEADYDPSDETSDDIISGMYIISYASIILNLSNTSFRFYEKISFMNISWDEQQEDFPDGKLPQSMARQNSQMAIDPRQSFNKKLMASLSREKSDELDSDIDKVSFI